MINWKYKGRDILSHKDIPSEAVGFVYRLTYDDGRMYIGSKLTRSERRLKPTKAQLAIRKNYKRVELKDLPFIKYVGSSKDIPIGLKLTEKRIIAFTSNKRTLTYLETKLLFKHSVLESDEVYLNKSISGKYFDNCLDGLIRDF